MHDCPQVWPTDLGYDETYQSVLSSLTRLRSDKVHLVLLHWPDCLPEVSWLRCNDMKRPGATWKESWRALERLYAEGAALSIGVANFDSSQLQSLIDFARVGPHVVQNWFDPIHVDLPLLDLAASHQIIVQAYSPLRQITEVASDFAYSGARRELAHVARATGRDAHQIVLRWLLDLDPGLTLLVRSSSPMHLQRNLDVWSWTLPLPHLGHRLLAPYIARGVVRSDCPNDSRDFALSLVALISFPLFPSH